MNKSPSIFHSYGHLTGFFASPARVDEALSKQLLPVSTWRKRHTCDLVHLTKAGFRPASDIHDDICLHNSDGNIYFSSTVRYITFPDTRHRNLAAVKYKTIICQSLIELQNLGSFPGLTIFEDFVLIPCLEDGDPDIVGTQIRKMAIGTEGVIVLGQVWSPPLNQMDPYFDRVVWAYEIPIIMQKNKIIRPDYGQSTICE